MASVVSEVLPYEKLKAWQASHRLVLAVYRATKKFPDHEKYGLTSQARRAAASAPANIAEGSGSRSRPEFCRFLSIAIRSLRELGYWLTLARDLEYLTSDIWQELEKQRGEAGYLLWRLYQSLSR